MNNPPTNHILPHMEKKQYQTVKDVSLSCKSVVGGWQTCINDTLLIGPVFNKTLDLYRWQRSNLF